MSSFKFNNHKIHYEIYGKGKPILILNGILMSTKSWHEFIEDLSKNNKVILLDFIDQGKSDSYNDNYYTYKLQSEVVKSLLDLLDIKKINIVSISYGGEVAMEFSNKHPEYVDRLILFNTTAYTTKAMQELFKMWIKACELKDSEMFFKTTIPITYSQSFYESNYQWIEDRKQQLIQLFEKSTFLDRVNRLTNSVLFTDIRDKLKNIKAETLVVGSSEDYLMPINLQLDIYKNIKDANIIILPETGHATMYERPKLFVSTILGFINR